MLARCLLTLIVLLVFAGRGIACPFCSAESRTLTEELADCNYAVIARLVKPAAAQALGLNDRPQEGLPFGAVDPETGEAEFRIESLLVERGGANEFAAGDTVKAVFFGEPDFEAAYLLRGVGEPLAWAIPLKLSPTAIDYIKHLQTLPPAGADRLAYFQDYLEHEDTLLAQDAYDEFARAPYADVKGLRDRMDRDQLLAWIESPTVSPSRRRLFLTMLGVCGRPEDIPRIERLLLADSRTLTPNAEALAALSLAAGGPLSSVLAPETVRLDQRRQKLGLDAMVACYLALRGGEGLDVIDKRFLADPDVDYSHVYATLIAIRFLAEESDLVSRERLLQSARLLLDNRDFADQVIPDLARWEDWSVLDQLVAMYKGTVAEDNESPQFEKYIRDPIVTYLDVAVEQGGELAERAQAGLDELEPIDPEVFRRSRSLRSFGILGRAAPQTRRIETPPAEADIEVELEPLLDDGLADELSDEPFEPTNNRENSKSAELDLPPSPAEFNTAKATASSEITTVENIDNGDVSASEPTPPTDVKTPAESAPTVAASTVDSPPAPVPPSRLLLIGAPLLAFAGFFGLFWFVLHGSA